MLKTRKMCIRDRGEDTPFDVEGEDPEKIDHQIRSYLTRHFKKSAG